MIRPARNGPPFNILYIHETARISGAENSLLNLIRRLDKAVFKPSFVLPEEGPLAAELRAMAVPVRVLAMPPVRRLFGVSTAVKNINKIAGDDEIDLVHSNSIRTHFYASMAGKKNKVPVVWHQRNLITNEIIDPDRLFSFLPDKIVCNSEAVALRFAKNGRLPDKVAVVYNGIDTGAFNPSVSGGAVRRGLGIGEDEIVVGIASRFNQLKGHETFLDAAKILLRDVPHAKLRFLLVGGAVFEKDKARETHLRALASVPQLKAKVVFAGFRKDMPEVYASMDILVLASSSEACGRVVIEAMASGKPVVGTDCGGTPELIEDGVTGILFAAGDENGLAKALKALIDDGTKRKAMGEAGRKRAEEMFGIEANVAKTQEIYRQLLGER